MDKKHGLRKNDASVECLGTTDAENIWINTEVTKDCRTNVTL